MFWYGWDKQDAARECLFPNETDVSRKSIKLGEGGGADLLRAALREIHAG